MSVHWKFKDCAANHYVTGTSWCEIWLCKQVNNLTKNRPTNLPQIYQIRFWHVHFPDELWVCKDTH